MINVFGDVLCPGVWIFCICTFLYIPAMEQLAATLEKPRAFLVVTFWCDISLILYPPVHTTPDLFLPVRGWSYKTPLSLSGDFPRSSHRHLEIGAQIMSLDSASRAGFVCHSSFSFIMVDGAFLGCMTMGFGREREESEVRTSAGVLCEHRIHLDVYLGRPSLPWRA